EQISVGESTKGDVTDILGDAHFQLRDMLVELDHPGVDGKFTVAGTPLKLGLTPGGVRQRAPLLGEHTEEILAQLPAEASAKPSVQD
ncbi:MAG: CoA transferase, partial [Gammaproteobacteria bacterium]